MMEATEKWEFPCTFHKIFRFLIVLTALSLLLNTVSAGADEPVNVYRSVPTQTNRIALTFDDGPHPYQTQRILNILERYGVKATFFMVGMNVQNYPSVAREVYQRGHEIGNHTFSHRHLKALSAWELTSEIEACEAALEGLCECRPHLFRPPEGAITDSVLECAREQDYELILWSIDTRDWESRDAQAIVTGVLEQVHPGDIILMHDYIGRGTATPQALEMLLPELLARGYEPVTVSTLLGI